MIYELVVPVPPSNNHRLGRGKYGIYRTKKATNYQTEVQWICKQRKMKPLEGDLGVEITWYRAQKKGDIMERFKDLFDAMEGYAYGNDKQIRACRYERMEDPKKPRVHVRIYSWEDREAVETSLQHHQCRKTCQLPG